MSIRYIADADWEVVEKSTQLDSLGEDAKKMAYWQMFTQGLLSKSAVQRLLVWADAARNQEGWSVDQKGKRDEVAKKIEKQKYPGSVEEAERRRSKYTRRLTSAVAYIFHACDAVLTTTALVVEFVPSMAALRKGLFIYNACYVGIFCMVVMGEIFVFRRKFFSDLWHVSGLVCMCLGLFDALILSTVDNMQQSDHAHSRSSLTGAEMEFLRVFVIITRYFRLYKVLEITPAALSLLLRLLDYRMGRRVIWGYDLARGYVMGEGEVMRQLGEVADGDSSLAADIRRHCTQSRLRVIRSMGLLQMRHPGVAGRVKTRYAACIVLNSKRDVIKEMGEEGLLEDTDIKLLLKNVELKMKKLANSAPRVPEVGLSDIVSNLPWVCGDSSLHDFIIQHGQVLTLDADQVLVEEGCPPGDIYVIISGVAKVEVGSRLQPEAGGEQDEAADYMTTGNVIGEYSLVTRSPMAHSVRAFTQLKVLFLNADTMRTAMSLTSEVEDNRRERNDENEELPSLEYRLWRAVATRIAYKVLLDEPAFMRVHKHGLRMRLADAYLVDGEERTEVIRDSTMSDLILVHGRAMDNLTREVYDGPCYLPFNVISLSLVSDSNARAILFIVPAGGDSPAPRHVLRSPASASGSLAFNNTHKKKMHEEPAPPLDRRHSVCAPSGPARGTSSSNVLLPRRTRRSLHSKRNSSPAVLDEHFVGGWDSLGAAALASSPASPLSHRANHEPHATHVSEYSSFALRFPRTLWGSIGEEHSRHRLYLPRPSLTSLSIDSVEEEDGDSSSRQGDASSAYYSPALSPASLSPVLGSGTWNFFADNKGRVISGKGKKTTTTTRRTTMMIMMMMIAMREIATTTKCWHGN
ncbi:uncharacterized protein LOC112558660 [Pomacea canaliculata]|uniref:uncharacterized protein LOC112558660 n=1 Tax=Pomacea canaliculata TaxID=400727 RepID=UPI000D73C4CD|nr:uncharacterized protein LOC112558660 [Pomacea canaliculata]